MQTEEILARPADKSAKQPTTVSRDMYESLLQSRQKSNADKHKLRTAVKDAIDLLDSDFVEEAKSILMAVYDATRPPEFKSTDDCGCGS